MSMEFNFNGLAFKVFENVYEPAEDSFLLAKYAAMLKGDILEIGCGSGIVSLVNANHNPRNRVIGCDINKDAVRNAGANAKLNKITNAQFIESDLFSKIKVKFTHILFNPPYLPTLKEEKISTPLNDAFDGGKDGRKIIDAFIEAFPAHLRPNGSVLLVHSSLNNLKQTKWKLAEKGFSFDILEEEKFFFEKLHLLKITKTG
jgi:release factor glutamine methyltransferase